LDYGVPASKIAGLSSGEFVGMVTDDPTNNIDLKVFHCRIQNDHEAIRQEEMAYEDIPSARAVSRNKIIINYQRIKEDIKMLTSVFNNEC
jgi:hypothetical protein